MFCWLCTWTQEWNTVSFVMNNISHLYLQLALAKAAVNDAQVNSEHQYVHLEDRYPGSSLLKISEAANYMIIFVD